MSFGVAQYGNHTKGGHILMCLIGSLILHQCEYFYTVNQCIEKKRSFSQSETPLRVCSGRLIANKIQLYAMETRFNHFSWSYTLDKKKYAKVTFVSII